jgi:hypothetical protein
VVTPPRRLTSRDAHHRVPGPHNRGFRIKPLLASGCRPPQLLVQLGHLGPLRGRQPVSPCALVALGLLEPLPHGRLGEVQVPGHAARGAAGWRTSATFSALNSGVNDRRRRGSLPAIVSIVDILSGATPLIADVRQTGSIPGRRPPTRPRPARSRGARPPNRLPSFASRPRRRRLSRRAEPCNRVRKLLPLLHLKERLAALA